MDHAAALIGFLTRIFETIAAFSGTSVLLEDLMYRSPSEVYANAQNILQQATLFGSQQAQLSSSSSSNSFSQKQPLPPPASSEPSYLSIIGLTNKDIGRDVIRDLQDSCVEPKTLDKIELEDDICETLGRYRDALGRPLLTHLANKPYRRSGIDTIVASGAKGDVTAIVQNMEAVGQQNNENSLRYEDTTSHYYRNECAKYGFVQHALIDLLTPTEYFFCLRSGRVGLVRTSCETAGIGYVYRKIFKSLEDLRICFGNTVRNGNGHLILFSYGFDSTFLRPIKLETVIRTIAECVEMFATQYDKKQRDGGGAFAFAATTSCS